MVRRLAVLAVTAVMLVVGGRYVLNAPVDPRSTASKTITILPGRGVRSIAQLLRAEGLLRSPTGFVILAMVRGLRDDLKAGTYVIRPSESGSAILDRIARGDAVLSDVSVTIPEGFTLRQIAERLAAQHVTDAESFRSAATVSAFRAEFPFLADAPADASLEGFLFPDTYRFHREEKPEAVIRRMLSRFGEQWQTVRATVSDVSVRDLVTMASIVEREVKTAEDRKLVAGILWKRLQAGRGLDADATVRYALNDWERALTVEDLALDSPYNTRRYRGLPPGPIGNLGLASLSAAAEPTASDWWYYLSAPGGQTIFSKTLEEHNVAKAVHLKGALR